MPGIATSHPQLLTMRYPRLIPHSLVVLLALTACSAATSGTSSTGGRNLDLIGREEIVASNRSTAWEVIEMIRPQWLQGRSVQSVNRQGGILIYLDDVRYGNLDALRTINARDLWAMERFNGTAASQRWGPGHSDGVIVISTRAPRS
jgi:hypothetical protein